MACMILSAQSLAMATTQLQSANRVVDSAVWQLEVRAETALVRMSWVVVSDKSGRPRLQMHWTPSAGNR